MESHYTSPCYHCGYPRYGQTCAKCGLSQVYREPVYTIAPFPKGLLEAGERVMAKVREEDH